MKAITKNPKDLQFSKADRKVLLKYLEKFYVTKLTAYNFHQTHNLKNDLSKTRSTNIERKFRMDMKAVEGVLYTLGSEFMSNVKIYSFRETTNLAARANGLVQDRQQQTDNSGS